MSIIKLIKEFNLLTTNSSCVFIVRHAEKPVVNNMYVDMANALTQKGVKSAQELGRELQMVCPQVGGVRSSPIARCLETADNIFLAYSQKSAIFLDTDLGGDGVYVSDNQLAAQYFLENPSRKDIFIKMQKGEHFSGMRDANVGTRILLKKVLNDLQKNNLPNFYITHDCILALFVGVITKQIVNEMNWFQCLEGVCIKKDKDKVYLYWDKRRFDIAI